jgi:hypothetical protein
MKLVCQRKRQRGDQHSYVKVSRSSQVKLEITNKVFLIEQRETAKSNTGIVRGMVWLTALRSFNDSRRSELVFLKPAGLTIFALLSLWFVSATFLEFPSKHCTYEDAVSYHR